MSDPRSIFDVLDFQENLWQKKGISLIPVRYGHNYWGTRYHVNISVYQGDGSVAVTHGGIEMGQGINTKVAQVVAKELGVDLDMVRVKPSNNFANVNGSVTGGGMGSYCSCSVSLMAQNNFSFGSISMLRVLLNVKERKGLAPFGFILFPVSLELFALYMKINCN